MIQKAAAYLNKIGILNAFFGKRFIFYGGFMALSDFLSVTFSQTSVFVTVIITLAVAFVSGWTDAPNAIASSVASRCISIRHAVIIAAIADFSGAVIVGLFNSKVTETVMNIAYFGNDSRLALLSLSAAMSAVVIWAVSAWRFGIPTSESHALIAGLTGASVAVNNGFSGVESSDWQKVFLGIFLSTALGFASGYLISKLTVKLSSGVSKEKSDKFFKYSQIFASVLMSFMHGTQDSQKFTGILMLVASLSDGGNGNKTPLWMLVLCSLAIALGTATGGGRIIKAVGMDMIKLRKDQGFSADFAGALCLFISTLWGLPVSTTNTKTSAVMGVGVAKSVKSVDWRVAGEMILAWLLTFPGCGLLGWIVARLFLYIF